MFSSAYKLARPWHLTQLLATSPLSTLSWKCLGAVQLAQTSCTYFKRVNFWFKVSQCTTTSWLAWWNRWSHTPWESSNTSECWLTIPWVPSSSQICLVSWQPQASKKISGSATYRLQLCEVDCMRRCAHLCVSCRFCWTKMIIIMNKCLIEPMACSFLVKIICLVPSKEHQCSNMNL